MPPTPCPCSSSLPYAECCYPFHTHQTHPQTGEKLMRSRYSAYVLHNIDYIVATTVPSQQNLLNQEEMQQWGRETLWLGLEVIHHTLIGKRHAQVEFNAHFQDGAETACHHELSTFVNIDGYWYFIDPNVPLPTMKQACICGSGKKFKACCGQFFK